MNGPRFSLRQIQVFAVIAREGGIGRAAAALGLAQATVSEALSEFEAQLGRRLFDRVGKRLVLNPAGRAVLPEAMQIVDRVASLATGGAAGTMLTIGASVTVGNYVLPSLLIDFLQRNPGVGASVSIRNTRDMIAAMRAMEADIALVEGLVSDPDLNVSPWRRDELIIVAAPDHPLARRAARPSQLASARWILRERGAGTRKTFETAIAAHFAPTLPPFEVGGNELMKQMAMAGLGIGCLSASAAEGELQRGELARVRAPWLDLSRVLSVVIHRHRYVDAGLAAFIRHCEAAGDFPFRPTLTAEI